MCAACVPLITGCDAGERESAATDTANSFVSTLDNPADACARLSPKTQEALESQGEPCDRRWGRWICRGAGRPARPCGPTAQVHTGDDTLFLVELDTGWRVTAAGCRHETEESYQCVLAD